MSDNEPPSWPPADGTTARELWELDDDEIEQHFEREGAR